MRKLTIVTAFSVLMPALWLAPGSWSIPADRTDPRIGSAGGQPPQEAQVLTRLWERELEDATEALEVVPGVGLVRIGSIFIEGYDSQTGTVRWRANRNGAAAVHVKNVEGTPAILIFKRFDRPPPASGVREGASYSVSVVNHNSGAVLWDTGPRLGDALLAEAYPSLDRLLILVRGSGGSGKLFVLTMADGAWVWETDFGVLEHVPYGEVRDAGRYFAVAEEMVFRVDRRERTLSLSGHELSDGDMKWVGYLEEEEEGEGLVLNVSGDFLYASGNSFYCIDPSSGAVRWKHDDAWLPVEEQRPWLLTHLADGSRLQLFHVNSGDRRWRSGGRTSLDQLAIIQWNPEGILVGGGRGGTVLISAVDGRQGFKEKPRYLAGGRDAAGDVFVLPDGLLFVEAGPRGGHLLRVDRRGVTRWQAGLPAAPAGSGGSAGTGRLYSVPVGLSEDPGGGAIWLAGSSGGMAVLLRVNLGSGERVDAAPMRGTDPLLAADEGGRLVFFIDPEGRLVAGEI